MLVEPTPIRPRSRRSRARLALSVALAPAILIGIVSVGMAGGDRPQPSPPASVRPIEPSPAPVGITAPEGAPDATEPDALRFPSQIYGLPTRTVAETLEAYRAGRVDGLVAISGYLSLAGDAPGCSVEMGDRYCRRQTILADRSLVIDGSDETLFTRLGPHLHPVAMPGTLLPGGGLSPAFDEPPALTSAEDPVPVVVLGGFDDPRASGCFVETRPCEPLLSIEWVPWSDGSWHRATASTDPRLGDASARLAIVDRRVIRASIQPAASPPVLELLVRPDTLLQVDPIAFEAVSSLGLYFDRAPERVWYVRAISPGPPSSRAGSLGMSWIVFDDTNGMVLAAGPQD